MVGEINSFSASSNKPSTLKTEGNGAADTIGSTKADSSAPSAQVPKQDELALTDDAKLINSMHAKLNTMPDIDQSKVDQIKAAIASGDYTVDPKQVADKLIAIESASDAN